MHYEKLWVSYCKIGEKPGISIVISSNRRLLGFLHLEAVQKIKNCVILKSDIKGTAHTLKEIKLEQEWVERAGRNLLLPFTAQPAPRKCKEAMHECLPYMLRLDGKECLGLELAMNMIKMNDEIFKTRNVIEIHCFL